MSKSIEQLRALAAQIEEAYRQGENTQVRVGGLFMDIIDFMSSDDFDKIFRKSDWHLRQIEIIRCMIRNNGYLNS